MTTIFQILITDESAKSDVPAHLSRSIQALRTLYPGYDHQLLRSDEIRSILGSQLPSDVLRAYDCLRPYAYKADLAKYAIIFLFGGWYYDVGVRPVTTVPKKDGVRLLAFRDTFRHTKTSWAVSTSIFYAEREYSPLKFAMDIIVANCREKYYGVSPLCPTGPNVFGRALAQHGKPEEYMIGDFRPLTPDFPRRNRSFLTNDGTFVALAKATRAGTLESLGYKGVNNYNEFWLKRTVYADF